MECSRNNNFNCVPNRIPPFIKEYSTASSLNIFENPMRLTGDARLTPDNNYTPTIFPPTIRMILTTQNLLVWRSGAPFSLIHKNVSPTDAWERL